MIAAYKEGKTYQQIADLLGRPFASVHNRIAVYNERSAARRAADDLQALTPYPGVKRCSCGLALPCNACTGRNVIEYMHAHMRRPYR